MHHVTARLAKDIGAAVKGVFLKVGSESAWPKNQSANRQFVERALQTLAAYPFPWTVGVYTNLINWTQIVGRDWSPRVAGLQLWRSHVGFWTSISSIRIAF